MQQYVQLSVYPIDIVTMHFGVV